MQYGGFIPNCQPVHVAELAKQGESKMSRLTTNYRDLGFYGGVPINRTAGKGISYKKRPSEMIRAKCKATEWVKTNPKGDRI